MAFVPFIGYGPDLDPLTPGVFTDCSAIVPSVRGFKGAPSPVATALPALAGACYGAASMRKTDDTTRIFAATNSHIYEGSTTAWSDRTTTAGFTTLGSSQSWNFTQFGDTILAASKVNVVQFLNSASVFAATTTTAPKCGDIEAVNNFVIGFDVSDQGGIYDSADRPDGWWAAAKGGFGDWVPSTTTEAVTGTLKETPGKIICGRRFGYQCIAYKMRSMYIGTYVGQPTIWDWQLIPGDAGALSKYAVVSAGTPDNPVHFFMGWDNFYSFAGGRAVPIGNPVRDAVFRALNLQYYYAALALHDAVNKRIYFYYPTLDSRNADKCVVYNYLNGKWGRDDRTIEAVMDYLSTGMTYDQLGTYYSTYNDLPNAPYDSAFTTQSTPLPAIFDTSHIVNTLTGTATTSTITLGDGGDGVNFFTMTRMRPRFLTAPSAATFQHLYRDVLSDTKTIGYTATISNGRFDLGQSARWHSGILSMTGAHEITGMDPEFVQDGEE